MYIHLYIRYIIDIYDIYITRHHTIHEICVQCMRVRPQHLDQVGEALPGEAPVWQAASC